MGLDVAVWTEEVLFGSWGTPPAASNEAGEALLIGRVGGCIKGVEPTTGGKGRWLGLLGRLICGTGRGMGAWDETRVGRGGMTTIK